MFALNLKPFHVRLNTIGASLCSLLRWIYMLGSDPPPPPPRGCLGLDYGRGISHPLPPPTASLPEPPTPLPSPGISQNSTSFSALFGCRPNVLPCLRTAVLKNPGFFVKGTTNRQPPTVTNRQPPTATNRQPPTATNRQPPTATNHEVPTANRRPQPTATDHQPPTAANRQPLK